MSTGRIKLIVATRNTGKEREFRQMLGSDRFDWSDLPPGDDAPEETGKTFLANACLKAAHYARITGAWALADDSGLEVDALGGRPGVVSARWAELHNAGQGDAANNALLLQQVTDFPDNARGARFVCELALANPAGDIILTARGTIAGRLLRSPRGENGFGYDPLFLVDHLGKTTAELSTDEKHAISHRGSALRRLRGLMEVGLSGDSAYPQ
jgi:non-canonical purine NTP pyrophosphatase (RdgB/HAM1 family)